MRRRRGRCGSFFFLVKVGGGGGVGGGVGVWVGVALGGGGVGGGGAGVVVVVAVVGVHMAALHGVRRAYGMLSPLRCAFGGSERRRRKKSGDELFLLFFLDLENVSFVFRFPKKQLTGRVVDANRLLAGTAARGDAPKGLARAAERKLVFCFGFSIVMVMGSTTAEP